MIIPKIPTRRSGHASHDAFDSPSQREQIAVATDGRIEFETEWKSLCVHGHRQADSGNTGRVGGCVFRDRKTSVTSCPATWKFHWFSIRGAAQGV
jgi:CelD/BcsL family acetyltransferase involved in cellulose biosynthesis